MQGPLVMTSVHSHFLLDLILPIHAISKRLGTGPPQTTRQGFHSSHGGVSTGLSVSRKSVDIYCCKALRLDSVGIITSSVAVGDKPCVHTIIDDVHI